MVAVISHNGWNKRQQRASHVRTPVAPFPRVASYLRISRNERSFPQDAFPFFYSLSLSFFPFLKLSLSLQSSSSLLRGYSPRWTMVLLNRLLKRRFREKGGVVALSGKMFRIFEGNTVSLSFSGFEVVNESTCIRY